MNEFGLRPDATGGFDFVVDGRFLGDIVFAGVGMENREVTLLRRGLSSGAAQDQIRRLKGELPGEFFPHRVWLYFCAACYDEGCGGISAKIQIGAEQVVWSDFRHDGEPDTDDESEHFDEEDAIAEVGRLVFDRAQYEAVLDETAKQLGRSFVSFWRTTDNLNQSTLGLERVVTRRPLRKRPPDPKEGLQWTIDGRPLARILRDASGKLSKRGRELQADLDYSVVQEGNGEYADEGRKTIRLLLGEGTWDDLPGRVPLLVGDCLDIPCGVITAHIERMDSIVVWSGFRVHGTGPNEYGHPYDPELVFTFDRQQHDDKLRQALDRT